MSESSKAQNYLHGAAILTATAAIVKILGGIYKIPLGNLLTDEGYSYFTVAYRVYSLLLTLSTAGLPVALSRLISTANATGRYNQVKRNFSVALTAFTILGLAGTLVMLLFPDWLAGLMNSPNASLSIMALAPAVVFVCLLAAYRGYAQGHENMKPTAISQIIEVVVKLVVGLGLAWLLSAQGYGLPVAAAGAILGVTVSEFLAFLYVFFCKRRIDRAKTRPLASPDVPDSRSRTLGRLLKVAIPITIGSSILSIIDLIDTALILNRLQSAVGLTETQASVLNGIYSKAGTLFALPSYFIVSITISMIPAVSAYLAKSRRREAAEIASSSMRMTALIALPAGVGLSVLSYPIMKVLYPEGAAEGPQLLAVLGIASFFLCMSVVTNSVLQAYGYERIPVYTLPVGGLVKILLNWVLVGNPDIGIYGAPVGSLACYAIITILNMIIISRKIPEPMRYGRVLFKPALSALVMGAAAYGVYFLAHSFLPGLISSQRVELLLSLVLAIGVAVLVYFVMIILSRAITREDMKLLPKGEKIADILRIR